ncbi:MAG: amidohydrolase family protein [Dehalococcoidia bacterium]
MKKIIKCKNLIHDPSLEPIQNGVIVVEGQFISEVGDENQIPIPENAEVIDCSNETVMPGLIDSHSHITANYIYNESLEEQHSADLTTASLRGSMNLRSDMNMGVTTMRTLGDQKDVELRFKKAIDEGVIPGPRLIISIRALRPSHGTAPFLATTADGPDDLRVRIRENYSMGAQCVKLFATNIANGNHYEDYLRGDLTGTSAYTHPELQAAIDEAHTLGMTIAAHAIGGPSMRWAMELGIDSIEHGNMLEEQDLEIFLKNKTFLSDPNLQLFFDHETGFPSRDNWNVDWWQEKVIEARERSAKLIPELVKSGGKICLAGDSGHSVLWREMMHMVNIGCSTKDTLLAVTKNSAELLKMDHLIGTIEKGKFADIISVNGDPLSDITVMQNVKLIMKEGKVYKDLI